MAVTVTKTAMAAMCSERWTNFSPSFLQYMDSHLAICRLEANDSEKWGVASNFGFSIPSDATIINVSTGAYWWGSSAGSYISITPPWGGWGYDTGAVSGRWMGNSLSPLPTPAQMNHPSFCVGVRVGRTTGAAVNVYIDQIVVNVTYEPYVAPPAPPTYAPTVTTFGIQNITSTTAVCGGTINSNGGLPINDHGLAWSTSPNPRVGLAGVGGGDVGSEWNFSLTGLTPGARYYVAAYAGNANGYGFGADVAFDAAPQKAGDGGIGIASAISGQSTGYAGGGGGGMLGPGSGGQTSRGGGEGGGSGGNQIWDGNPGVVNTGGGGGGAGTSKIGGAGGKGIVIVRYKTADAVSTSPTLESSIFRPSIAYRGGKLFAPYSKGEDAKILTIMGNTVAAATVISTAFPVGNIVPQMTSATTPGGVASSNNNYSETYAAWKAFDHSDVAAGSWMAGSSSTGWLQYQFPAESIIVQYAITSRNVASPHAPKTWTLQGSVNGTDWDVLDTQTNVTDWASSPNVRKVFDVANTTAYVYYRLDITACNGNYVAVGELELIAPPLGLAHGILADTAQVVAIAGSNSTPSIDGSHIATRIDDLTFSIPVNVTTAGTKGLVLYNHSVGWAITSGGYNDVGWLTQSPTTFHTGTMKKDYRYISVSHDVLPDGATIRPASWLIGGVYGTATGIAYSPQETRFPIDQQGYLIETTMGMTPDYTKRISPVVKGVNVIWDFVKTPKHTYNLDCRKGAGNGRWKENPEEAIAALFQAADKRSTFEDRYNGVYTGIMDSIEFRQAARSLKEGPSGLVKIVVREVL